MKVEHYNRLLSMQASRRALLRGAASAGALALASGGALGTLTRPARAQDDLRAEILKIPGVGMGSPTDAD
jgi:multiple sugar transport system substrate-binding protein